MLTTLLLSIVSQAAGAGGPHARQSTVGLPQCVERCLPSAETSPLEAQYEEKEFLRRFNGLITAITDFSNTYNSRGVIDVRKVRAIRKAWRELERSDWFSPKHELHPR